MSVDPAHLQPPLDLFGPAHLGALAVVLLAAVAIPAAARRLPEAGQRRLARAFAVLLVTLRAAEVTIRHTVYGMPWKDQLPLHLCGALVLVSGWMLWTRNERVYEVVYFWTFAGASQALLTPDLPVGFPHPGFVLFFTTHGLLVMAAVYATRVFRLRPRPRSILRAFLWLHLLALAATPVNLLLDTNFLYLRHKPEGASLLDCFGPWPVYLGVVDAIALAVFALCYLPFWLKDLRESGHAA